MSIEDILYMSHKAALKWDNQDLLPHKFNPRACRDKKLLDFNRTDFMLKLPEDSYCFDYCELLFAPVLPDSAYGRSPKIEFVDEKKSFIKFRKNCKA